MSFWNWRRGPTTATSGSAAVAMASELAPIELYTADTRIVGWVAPGGRRVTNLLNDRDELRLWHPSPGPLDATPNAKTPPDTDTGEWDSVAAAQVLLAMPPEWRSSRQLRLHRRLRRVAMTVGPFTVTGNLHLHPGVEPGAQREGQRRGPQRVPSADRCLPAPRRGAAVRARRQRGHRQHPPRDLARPAHHPRLTFGGAGSSGRRRATVQVTCTVRRTWVSPRG